MEVVRSFGVQVIPMSHKVWIANSFLNLPVLKVSTNGRKINSVETRCLASSPRHNHSSDRKYTLKLLTCFVLLFAHFLLCFKISNTNRPFRVVRYFWLGLVGLSGMVMAIQFSSTKGSI